VLLSAYTTIIVHFIELIMNFISEVGVLLTFLFYQFILLDVSSTDVTLTLTMFLHWFVALVYTASLSQKMRAA